MEPGKKIPHVLGEKPKRASDSRYYHIKIPFLLYLPVQHFITISCKFKTIATENRVLNKILLSNELGATTFTAANRGPGEILTVSA